MTSEPTLGALYNRISVLIAEHKFRPGIPLSAILTTEERHAIGTRLPEASAEDHRDHG